MKTSINDNYKFQELECQYFELCKCYEPKNCMYSKPCSSLLIFDKKVISVRSVLRTCLESYVAEDNLSFQIEEME